MGREIHLGLDLNEEPMEGHDVDNHPTPIGGRPQVCEYAQLLSNFAMEHPLEFSFLDVTNMQSFMNTLSKMSISNINECHQKTIYSYFCSVRYSEDIIMGLFLNSILCDVVSIYL